MTIKIINIIFLVIITSLIISCSNQSDKESTTSYVDVATDPGKDAEIQKYNLDLKKARSERFPCDTISVIEYFLDNYPSGTYLLESDKTAFETLPKPAVYYHTDRDGSRFVFAVIATSRPGERLVETKNLVGYEQSYIDLDSTKLGTPFLYLVLLECRGNNLSLVWEAIIPSHGGFNDFSFNIWRNKNIPFIEARFYYAQGIGMISYNYFLINDFRSKPHLLMTYDGVDFRRTIADVNNDKYPDYYEYVFVSLEDRVYARDSVAFVWKESKQAYVNTRNARQTRLY